MKHRFAFAALLLSFCLFQTISAQKTVEVINSGQILKAGLKLHDEGKYDEAIEQYERIGRNDTNFNIACYEEAYSAYSLGHLDTVFRLCKLLIDDDRYSGSDAYSLYGDALDDKQKSVEAIEFYKTALKMFPRSYLLHFNLGVAYFRAKKYDEAMKCFQKTLDINPRHPTSHYFMGILLADNKRWAPALLAMHTAMLLGPNKSVENKCLNFMINIAKGDYTALYDSVPLSDKEDPAFVKIDKLIESKVALNADYKIATKIDDKLMKQTQLLLETMQQLQPASNNYFVKLYVPLYSEIVAGPHLKTFEYYAYKDVDNELITKWKSKSKKDIEEFEKWKIGYFDKVAEDYTDTVDGKTQKFKRYVYDRGTIQALGTDYDAKAQLHKGYWRFFYTNSNIESEGNYDNNGKRQGVWKSFYGNGKLSTVATYKDGKIQGELKDYYINGNIKRQAPFKDDLYEGKVLKYYNNGALESEHNYKAGLANGKVKTYFENGMPNLDLDAKNDKLDGKIIQYNAHGYVVMKSDAKDGEKDGPYEAYYSNGKLSEKGTVRQGKADGKWVYYNEDGKLSKECEFVKGDVVGVVKEYWPNGKVSSQQSYDNKGKLSGVLTDFDEDGIKYFEGTYKDDKMVNYKYLDKAGKVLHEASEQHGELEFKAYTAKGRMWKEGQFKKGDRQGKWTYYFSSGNVRLIEEYASGILNGPFKEYYRSGVLHKQGTYVNGKLNGNYKTYFENGKLQEEVTMVDGDREGDAYSYFSNGVVSDHNYYRQGDEHKWQSVYYPDGKLNYEYYEDGTLLSKYLIYDTAGVVVSKFVNPQGTAHFAINYFNGKPKGSCEYKEGHMQGVYKTYYGGGQQSGETIYDHNVKTGLSKEYHYNGKLYKEGVYKFGSADSVWTFFDFDGIKDCKGLYKNGDREGYWTWYYPNGKPEYVAKFKDDDKDSIVVLYAPDGQVRVKFKYDNGELLGYTYVGKDGKDVPDIKLTNESGNVTGYFENGQKSYECTYKNGWIQGNRKYYYPDGKIEWDENFEAGNKVGKQLYYHPDGKLQKEEMESNDEVDGPSKIYDKNGVLVREENYSLGYLHGVQKEYEGGKVKKTSVYYYGVELK